MTRQNCCANKIASATLFFIVSNLVWIKISTLTKGNIIK